MTTITQGKRSASFILNEAVGMRSRDNITIANGEGKVEPGTVLGKIGENSGAITVGAPTYVGTGNGVLTKANPAYGAGVKEGTYTIVCIEPASDGGRFSVEDPDGIIIGQAVVGVAFDDVIKFTIADGATDFLPGGRFTLAVSIAAAANAGHYRVADPTNTDGSQNGVAVNLYGCDATSAAVTGVVAITRDCEVNGKELTYDTNVDDAPKKAAQNASLASVGIIVR